MWRGFWEFWDDPTMLELLWHKILDPLIGREGPKVSEKKEKTHYIMLYIYTSLYIFIMFDYFCQAMPK